MSINNRTRVGDRVTIYPRGKNRIYSADFSQNGQHCRVSLKTRDKKTATQRAIKIESELNDGTFKNPIAPVAINAAVDSYLTSCATDGLAVGSIKVYRGKLYMLRNFCHRQRVRHLMKITPSLFDRYRALRKQTLGGASLSHEGIVILQFLNWCRKRNLIPDSPLKDYKIPKPVRRPKPAPSLNEVWQVLDAAEGQSCLELAVLAFTGMRSNELQSLLIEDVDLQENWIHIVSRPGVETKTRNSWKVPIHPALRAMLLQHSHGEGPWFFCAEPTRKCSSVDRPLDAGSLNKEFQRIARTLGMPTGRAENGYTLHTLRHFFETFTVNSGIPQRVIDAWLDHRSDRSMASIYYRLSNKDSQAFMEKVPFGTGRPTADVGTKE